MFFQSCQKLNYLADKELTKAITTDMASGDESGKTYTMVVVVVVFMNHYNSLPVNMLPQGDRMQF